MYKRQVIESGVTHVQEVQPDDLESDYVDGIVFNYDGTKMFITSGGESGGDNKIRQYKLTTAFSIATLSLEGTVELSNYSGLGSGRETAFNSDGSKMFVIDVDAEVYEFDLTCNWSIIDGACDDPITTSDGGKDILSSIESQTATAKQIAIQASTPVLNRMYWLRRHRTSDQLSNQNIKFNFPNKTIASLAKVIPISEKSNNTLNKLSDSWSFWSEGSVSFGKTGDTSSSSSKKINTKGITLGMDLSLIHI